TKFTVDIFFAFTTSTLVENTFRGVSSDGNGNPLLSTTSSAAIPAAYNSNGSVAYSPNARKHDRHRSLIFDSGQLIPDRPAIKSDEEGRQESVYPAAVRQLEHLNLERKSSVPAQVLSALTGSSTAAAHARAMGRVMRVVVAGCKKVGKTACLQQLACVNDITSQPYEPTIDDTYQVQMDYGDRPKEIMVFHDTAGLSEYGPVELRRPYIQVADAFVLVYSVVDHETFNRMDLLKKFIDKQFGKDKKEVPIVVLGNMIDLPGRKVDSEFAQGWANREKVKLYEVTATDRNTLVELVIYLGSRHFHSQRESKFSLSKKLKPEKSNAAIMMDL
uniref:NF-kappa-B inhibitor-interacting Ras-like protein n=1 Tax=Parascaris univalens TaxID=6257 RepID=A0A915ABT9_PARUN